MGIFDRFRSNKTPPQRYSDVNLEFTEEERAAIRHTLQRFAANANAEAPEGGGGWAVHPRLKDCLSAQGLIEYVEDLRLQIQRASSNDGAALMQKAIQAQTKAYAIHNLPVYLFQLAQMFELAGNSAKAQDCLGDFLRAQHEFRADKIDSVFLKQATFDMPNAQRMVEIARETLSRKPAFDKADFLGPSLVGGAREAAIMLTEEFGKLHNIAFRESSKALDFLIELLVFYMHLIDRLAFANLGPAKREVFGDRFVAAVVKELQRGLSKELSADDFCNALRDTYNRRQTDYERYKVWIPKKDGPLKDTLFWEASKILFAFFDDTNPATLVCFSLAVCDTTTVMLKDVLKVTEVLGPKWS